MERSILKTVIEIVEMFGTQEGQSMILVLLGGSIIVTFITQFFKIIAELICKKSLSGDQKKLISLIACAMSGFLTSSYIFRGTNLDLFIFGFLSISSLFYRFLGRDLFSTINLTSGQIKGLFEPKPVG